MEQFIYNDFISDDIPGCPLTNSKLVRKAIETVKPDDKSTILDISLIGLNYKDEILLEWQIWMENESHQTFVRLPVFIPPDKNLAQQQLDKHSKVTMSSDFAAFRFSPGDYFLMHYKYPCQLISDKEGNLYIKRLNMFASQKIVQEFLSTILRCDLVTATMVVINFHTLFDKGMHDIGWLVNFDGTPGIISIDRIQPQLGFIFIDGYDELPEESIFELNSKKYIVRCDDENGIYIAKTSQKMK